MSNKRVKIAITGAAGHIGYSGLLFRIASGQMLGPDTEIELQLLELEAALQALQGVRMELEDCAFPLLKNIVCTADVNEAMKDINWALLVGAVPRKEGMERSDLLKINGGIFTTQGQAINDNAASDVRVLVVGNPCNTNCLIAMNSAKDIPNERFYAMTMLDENRAKAQLALKAGVDVSEVSNMAIWGNHSTTQYPDYHNAKIKGKAATEVITDTDWLEKDFIPTVQKRGGAIIKARGLSSAASAAHAAISTVRNITFDTPADDFFSLAQVSHGEYGIEEGLIFSYPTRTENGQHQIVQGIEHGDFGKEKMKLTEDELKAERDTVRDLGLI